MTEQKRYTVHVKADGMDSRLHRAVLATLPNSFAISDERESDVVFLSRRDGPVLGGLGKLPSTTKAIVVSGAGALGADELGMIDAVTARGVAVVPAMDFMPRIMAQGKLVSGGEYQLVNHVCDLPHMSITARVEALAEQLTFVEYVTGSVLDLRNVSVTDDSVLVSCTADQQLTDIRLSMVRSPLGRLRWSVNLISVANRTSIEIDVSAMSRPAEVHHFDKNGGSSGLGVFQNSHRITWKSLFQTLSGHHEVSAVPFSDFALTLSVAREILQ